LRPPSMSVAPSSTACWQSRVMTETSRSCDRSARTDSIPVSRTGVYTAQSMYLGSLHNHRGRYVEEWGRLSSGAG
jgi:hypothetical protein